MNKAELGTLKAFKRYQNLLIDLGSEPINSAVSAPTSNNHLLWMCTFCIVEIKAERFIEDKYSRWLVFVQGVLAADTIIDVQQERDITREWFT